MDLHDANPERAHEALNSLCRIYWPPLYALARRKGFQPHDAKDLVQGLLQRLCERGAFEGLSPKVGTRFRSWLKSCLERFEIDEWRKHAAQLRGGKTQVASLHWEDVEGRAAYEIQDDRSPEAVYDASVARVVCGEAFRRLKEESARDGMAELYEELAAMILEGRSEDRSAKCRELSERFGMSTESLSQRRKRLKDRFTMILREEVRRLVPSDAEVDDEMRYLIRALC